MPTIVWNNNLPVSFNFDADQNCWVLSGDEEAWTEISAATVGDILRAYEDFHGCELKANSESSFGADAGPFSFGRWAFSVHRGGESITLGLDVDVPLEPTDIVMLTPLVG